MGYISRVRRGSARAEKVINAERPRGRPAVFTRSGWAGEMRTCFLSGRYMYDGIPWKRERLRDMVEGRMAEDGGMRWREAMLAKGLEGFLYRWGCGSWMFEGSNGSLFFMHNVAKRLVYIFCPVLTVLIVLKIAKRRCHDCDINRIFWTLYLFWLSIKEQIIA